MTAETPFLTGENLQRFLRLKTRSSLEDLFKKTLTDPVSDVMGASGKNLRRALVELGAEISEPMAKQPLSTQTLGQAIAVIELLHTGSLVVDDVEDESRERRGVPCVHRTHGVPIAINAGTWLYFQSTRLIEDLDVSVEAKHRLLKECNHTLLRAHYGQALDLGVALTALPQERVPEVAAAIVQLKSGELCSLAFKMGFVLHDLPAPMVAAADHFGRQFGIALQMFDDIGNIVSRQHEPKWSEDLRLKRITSLMSSAAEHLSPKDYLRLIQRIDSEDPENVLQELIRHGIIDAAKTRADRTLTAAIQELESNISLDPQHLSDLVRLADRLRRAYE